MMCIMRNDDMRDRYNHASLVHNLRPGTAYPANTLHTLRDRCRMRSPFRSRRTWGLVEIRGNTGIIAQISSRNTGGLVEKCCIYI